MAIIVNSQTKLTYEDHVQYPEDGRRHETIDGEHVVTPAPSPYHQTVSRRIQFQLYRQIEELGRGEVYDAPVDVQLSPIDIVEPDLVVILAGRKIVGERKIDGAPDLVIEILSTSTAVIDTGLKLALYQKAGVPEYWIVDSERRSVLQYVLDGEAYTLRAREERRIVPATIDDVVIDLEKVW